MPISGFDFSGWLIWTQAGSFVSLAVQPYLRTLFAGNRKPRRGILPLAAILLQSELFYGVAVAAGMLAARAGGLAGNLARPPMVARAVAAGALVAAGAMALDRVFFSSVRREFRGRVPHTPLWTRLLACLYGAVSEEIVMRLGVLTVLAASFRMVLRQPGTSPANLAMWAAIVVSSLLFGAGHLPATARLVKLTPIVVSRALILNGIGGVVFGFLYWNDGLGSAMAAHGAADLLLHVLPALAAGVFGRAK